MKSSWKNSSLLYLGLLLTGIALVTLIASSPPKPTEISLSEVITMSQDNKIAKLVEEGEWLTITATDGEELKANIGALNYNDLRELGLNTAVKYEIKPG
ncbi:MAG: hypothetical protein PHN78_02110, partial [Dehalococcoidales bacterium]|nr:hypothetical protein [Dehalococcoidales bacterium]